MALNKLTCIAYHLQVVISVHLRQDKESIA